MTNIVYKVTTDFIYPLTYQKSILFLFINILFIVGKKVYFSILIFCFFWNVLIFSAPVLIDKGGIYTVISGFIYELFSRTCHQIDSRSFHIAGFKLAVCSRCISVYLSFFIGCIVYPVFNKLDNKNLPSLWYLMIALFLLVLDVGLDLLDIMGNTFFTRAVTGGLIGVVLPFYIIPGFVNFFAEVISFLNQKRNLKNN